MESSDEGEGDAYPYTELLDMFGIGTEANAQEVLKKWKQDEKEVEDEKTDVNKKKVKGHRKWRFKIATVYVHVKIQYFSFFFAVKNMICVWYFDVH